MNTVSVCHTLQRYNEITRARDRRLRINKWLRRGAVLVLVLVVVGAMR